MQKPRGAKIYAEVLGGGMSADAYHITQPHPEGLGITLVMNSALEDAGITTKDVDYINTHGTSTPLGDSGEVKAISSVFGEHACKTEYQLNQVNDRPPTRCRWSDRKHRLPFGH